MQPDSAARQEPRPPVRRTSEFLARSNMAWHNDLVRLPLPETQSHGPVQRPQSGRFLLWVDGVGGYWVCLRDEVVLGQAASAKADVPILGDVSARHARIRRDGEGYVIEAFRDVRMDGRRVEHVALLSHGCKIQLGDAVRLAFRRPHALSATARLDFLSHHRTEPTVDAILLMAGYVRARPRPHSHVVCRDWASEVVFYRQEGQLYCRSPGGMEMDGVCVKDRGPVPATPGWWGLIFRLVWSRSERTYRNQEARHSCLAGTRQARMPALLVRGYSSGERGKSLGSWYNDKLSGHIGTGPVQANRMGAHDRTRWLPWNPTVSRPRSLRPTEAGAASVGVSQGRDSPMPAVRTPLDGYTIKRGVGQGGFGEIYYAVSDAGKEVALKLIRRNLDVELRGIRQCLNLKHPNLLDLYDIRQDDQGDTWVVMEYVAGRVAGGRAGRASQRPAASTRPWPGSTASAPAWPICTTTASSTAI